MDYIGQTDIVDGFRNGIKHDNLSHAFVLTGETGIGKKTLAHFIAKALLCTEKGIAQPPCGHCRACKSFDEMINPNFFLIRSETRNIVIKQIRELIEDISVRPLQGRKVYIIEDADKMTNQAQNCLLKTLEEPPAYATIILTTDKYEALLLTIRSRIVRINLKPCSINEMKLLLQKKGINFDGKEHLLYLSRGIPGKAIQLLADKNFEENREKTLNFVFNEDTSSKLDFNQYLSKNKNAFYTCIDILESIYRDTLLLSCSLEDGLINADKKDNILKYANKHSTVDITDKISMIEKVRSNMKRNMNYQLAVDMLTLEI
ncbi:MAG: ATP-binding protein [Acetivibrionales bacterium]|jgi:DNA polymerase-3 subunit delta'|nr:DNA polymerase III subunit [Clostridiaceae bacterium]